MFRSLNFLFSNKSQTNHTLNEGDALLSQKKCDANLLAKQVEIYVSEIQTKNESFKFIDLEKNSVSLDVKEEPDDNLGEDKTYVGSIDPIRTPQRHVYFGKNPTTQDSAELHQLYKSIFQDEFNMDYIFAAHKCSIIIYKLQSFFMDHQITQKSLQFKPIWVQNLIKITFLKRGIANIYLENYVEAINDFTDALAFDKSNSDILRYRSICYAQLGDFKRMHKDRNLAERFESTIDLYLQEFTQINVLTNPINSLFYNQSHELIYLTKDGTCKTITILNLALFNSELHDLRQKSKDSCLVNTKIILSQKNIRRLNELRCLVTKDLLINHHEKLEEFEDDFEMTRSLAHNSKEDHAARLKIHPELTHAAIIKTKPRAFIPAISQKIIPTLTLTSGLFKSTREEMHSHESIDSVEPTVEKKKSLPTLVTPHTERVVKRDPPTNLRLWGNHPDEAPDEIDNTTNSSVKQSPSLTRRHAWGTHNKSESSDLELTNNSKIMPFSEI